MPQLSHASIAHDCKSEIFFLWSSARSWTELRSNSSYLTYFCWNILQCAWHPPGRPSFFTHITARCITNSWGLAFLPGTHPHLKRSLQENIKTWSFTFVLWCSMESYRFEIILAFQSNHNSSNGWVSPTAGECHPAQCTIQLSPHMNAQHALRRENYVGFLFWYGLILVLPRFHHILIHFWSSWIMGTARHENYLKPLIVGKLDLGWTLSRSWISWVIGRHVVETFAGGQFVKFQGRHPKTFGLRDPKDPKDKHRTYLNPRRVWIYFLPAKQPVSPKKRTQLAKFLETVKRLSSLDGSFLGPAWTWSNQLDMIKFEVHICTF